MTTPSGHELAKAENSAVGQLKSQFISPEDQPSAGDPVHSAGWFPPY